MGFKEEFKFWLENDYFDQETKDELLSITKNEGEIQERFYKNLEFGTGGLRGVIGAGTNRMNIYTVRKASQGLANYVLSRGEAFRNRGIVIAFDSRKYSDVFALEVAKVFAGNGIKAYLFDELRPVPELSFAVRKLGAAAGVVITASHNPKEYNGYKAYGDDGAQYPLKEANMVLDEVNKIEDITKINIINQEEAKVRGLLEVIGEEVDNAYITTLKNLLINPSIISEHQDKFKILYTPIHGAGNKIVRRILKEVGILNVDVLKSQEMPDPDFSTVKTPNPEDVSAFELGIIEARNINADIIIGTDPDSDRVGVMVRVDNNEYKPLTGNQVGLLLLEYILGQLKNSNRLPSNGFVVKTIVTTELARNITQHYNIELIEVLTGFKFIGEKIKYLDEFGDKKYLFGFEESYGYLFGTDVRDKDAVVTSMLISEMAIMYKSKNMNLIDGINQIYDKYGASTEDLSTYTLKGREGLEKIIICMNTLREQKGNAFTHLDLVAIRDYNIGIRYDLIQNKTSKIDLPSSDVLYYELSDKSWYCIRPSGTEPKIKIYYGTYGQNVTVSQHKLRDLKDKVNSIIDELIK